MKDKIMNICPICNERPLKLIKNCKTVYRTTCGERECWIKSIQMTNIKKYGHVCTLHGKNKQKTKNIFLEKYGVENVSQLGWVKEKKINTCRENFGCDHPMQSAAVMEKSKQSLMKLYGVTNIFQVPSIIDRIRDKMFEVDPILGISKYELSRIKCIDKNMKKYGIPYYCQTDEFKKKSTKTIIERYGVDNYSKTKEFQEFLISSGIKKSDDVRDKFDIYYGMVIKYTNRTFRKYKQLLQQVYIRSKKFHLDHVYSITDGFKNNIDPKIIGSISNLQLLPAFLNIQKNYRSWITKDKLLEAYNKLSDEDKYITG